MSLMCELSLLYTDPYLVTDGLELGCLEAAGSPLSWFDLTCASMAWALWGQVSLLGAFEA